ncbi:DNA topoisomerase IV [Flavobacterium piscinae]|uniref:DNA topoisomerase IV n=1 Tax=Flavobacterium piscinae TaxID=2506424 RepID=A0A4Q1KQZ3_9FLAO|nr:DNA topoisomerase IV [Flavobacterium piscinae]RXR32573.1 DNA topoisomerase IV [Flavobacterium piscinae]
MKKILPILSLLFISCYQQERNCSDFKTGKFQFELEIDGKKEISVFERNDTLQIETFRGKTDTSSVRWINDCELVLQKLHPKNRKEKKAIHMKILTTKDKNYTFEYSFVGESTKQKGIVTKVN